MGEREGCGGEKRYIPVRGLREVRVSNATARPNDDAERRAKLVSQCLVYSR
jgi:hypothetical protein